MELPEYMAILKYSQEGRLALTEATREWIGYPLVRDCTPMVFIADFTNVSGEGLSQVGLLILASFVAT